MDDRLIQARLYAEKMIRDRDPLVKRCGEDLRQLLDDDDQPSPLLHVIFDALRERGWATTASPSSGSILIDPEGNRYGSVEAAIEAQTFREIAAVSPPPEGNT